MRIDIKGKLFYLRTKQYLNKSVNTGRTVSYLTGSLRYHGEGFIIAQDGCRLYGAQTTDEPNQ
jgi:hypothetical protein